MLDFDSRRAVSGTTPPSTRHPASTQQLGERKVTSASQYPQPTTPVAAPSESEYLLDLNGRATRLTIRELHNATDGALGCQQLEDERKWFNEVLEGLQRENSRLRKVHSLPHGSEVEAELGRVWARYEAEQSELTKARIKLAKYEKVEEGRNAAGLETEDLGLEKRHEQVNAAVVQALKELRERVESGERTISELRGALGESREVVQIAGGVTESREAPTKKGR